MSEKNKDIQTETWKVKEARPDIITEPKVDAETLLETDEISEDKLVRFFQKSPKQRFIVIRIAYRANWISLAEAAAAFGSTMKQFQELNRNYTNNVKAAIPNELLVAATEDEQFLISYLPQRVVDILKQLLTKDILLPMSQSYIGYLWEDLCLLKNLRLVKETERYTLYRYSLNLKNI